jgi:hypothetical protein
MVFISFSFSRVAGFVSFSIFHAHFHVQVSSSVTDMLPVHRYHGVDMRIKQAPSLQMRLTHGQQCLVNE